MPFSIRFCRRWPVACVSLFIALQLLSSRVAYAEWVEVGITNEATVYADPGTIQRKGDVVKMWHLHDFKTTQTVLKKSSLSSRSQNEYDCTANRVERCVRKALKAWSVLDRFWREKAGERPRVTG